MADIIQLRRDTKANWATTNPVLALGEPGLETDTRKVKYGDGTTAWNNLPYGGGPGDGVYDVSEANNGAVYESLSEALAAVPTSERKAGMTIRFIKNTNATYNVVRRASESQPSSGNALAAMSSVESGTYEASQLTDFATMPTTSAVVYYFEESGTYTVWTITRATVETKYEEWRYMNSTLTGFTTVANWQGVDDIPTPGSNNKVKSGGVNNAIKEIALDNYNKVDSELTQVNYAILDTGFFSNSSNYKHCYLPVNVGEKYIIKGFSVGRYAFATSNEYSSGGDIPLVEETSVHTAYTEDYFAVEIPEGCTWLLLNSSKEDNNVWKWNGSVNEQIAIAKDYADSSIAETEKKLSEVYAETEVIDLEDVESLPMRKGLFSTGVWTGATSSYYHLIFDVFGDDCLLRITASDENVAYVAFVSNLDLAYNNIDVPLVDGTSVIKVAKGNTQFIPVPKEAVAVIVYMGTSTESAYPYKPNAITIYRNRSVRNTDGVAITAKYLYGTSEEEPYYTDYRDTAYSYVVKVRKGDSLNISAFYSGSGVGTYKYMGFIETVPRTGVYIHDCYLTTSGTFRKNFVAPIDGWFVCLARAANSSFEVTSHKSASADAVAIRNDAAFNKYLSTLNFEQIDLIALDKYNYVLLFEGIYGSSTSYITTFVDVRNVAFIKITANDTTRAIFGFVESIGTPKKGGIPEYAPSSQGVMFISAGETKILEVPDDANYVIVLLGSKTRNSAPTFFGIYKDTQNGSGFTSYEQLIVDFNSRRDRQVSEMLAIGLSPLNPATDSEGWELPSTLQQLNAQKKSEQLVNIKWIPKLNVPAKYAGVFPAGVEVNTGIPYSSNNDDGAKKVGPGQGVSIHTFMTAIDNPYSLMYTECVNNETKLPNNTYQDSPTKKSYWGKEYVKSSNGFAYYGTICCGFTSSVENAPLVWNNNLIKDYILSNGVYIPVCPAGSVNFDLLKIGDICDNAAHSFLIYGLHRDTDGKVDKVSIAESTSGYGKGGCRIYTFESREAFKAHVNRSGNPFTVFRYMKLWDNTDYEASEYVPLTDRGEMATAVTYNNAICTFAGDKCTFRETDLVVINYNLYGEQEHQWTKIQVYKDDVLFGEYTLTQAEQSLVDYLSDNNITPNPFNEGLDEHNHALVLGKELKAGMYKACMSDGTNFSEYTYWEILPNDLTVVEKGTDEYEIAVSGKYLTQAIYLNGMPYLPTYEEQAAGKFTLRPHALSKLFGKSYDGYEVSVKLKGEYGNITTVPVKIYGDDVDPEDEPETDDN